MKTLFLSIVLLGLVAALQAQDPLSFPSEELNITGTWYTKAVVFNMTQVPGWKRPSKVVPMRVTALEDGTWEAKTTLLINGRCLEKKITLQKTEEPGRYRGFVLVEELPEQEHYIFYCQDQGPGKTPHMAKLMGEQPRESPSPAHVPLPKLEDTATPWNQALQPLGWGLPLRPVHSRAKPWMPSVALSSQPVCPAPLSSPGPSPREDPGGKPGGPGRI
uniref:Lipocalin/cytosolic fatty-acid binding domain-containing protein n=1 Tax=Sciurus vulgaris TaxID=55149 RepID=A0A8D2DLG6_SCIVU